MSVPLAALLFLATVIGMEGFAYVMHRWVMHGPGWFLHESHHRPRTGNWELNDLYAVIFAVPSIMLIAGGMRLGWWPGCTWVGAGIAAYGAIYFGFHDVIVHRRLPTRYLPRSAYMKRIVQAHRLHHVVETKAGTVSFGFLVAPRPEALKAELRRRRHAGVRAPVGFDPAMLDAAPALSPTPPPSQDNVLGGGVGERAGAASIRQGRIAQRTTRLRKSNLHRR